MGTVTTTQAPGFRVVTYFSQGGNYFMHDMCDKVFSSEGEADAEADRLETESEARHKAAERRCEEEHDISEGYFCYDNFDDQHVVVTDLQYSLDYADYSADQDIRYKADQAEKAQAKVERDEYIKIHGKDIRW